MSKLKVKINRSEVRALLQSEEMQTVLSQYAREIQGRCGDGYEHDIYVGKNRANAQITAKSFKAKRDNLKNNTLLKAVRG